MSGMLLYQSIVFGNKYYSEDNEVEPVRSISEADTAAFLHIFKRETVLKYVLSVRDIDKGVELSPEAVRWFHTSSITVLSQLIGRLSIPASVVELFRDTTFRNRDKVTEDGAILLSVISVCLHDRLICGKKMVLYKKDNLLISLEHQLVATIKSMDALNGTDSVSSSFFSSFMQLDDDRSAYSVNPMVEEKNETKPAIKDTKFLKFNDFNGLSVHLINDDRNKSSRDSQDHSTSCAVLTDLMNRCIQPEFVSLVKEHGTNFITCEILKSMQGYFHPVVGVLTRSQLGLHETVFVRTGMPSHNDVETLRERADTIDHVIKLIRFICNSGTRGLELLESQFTDDMSFVRELLKDIIDENDYTIESMTLAQEELQVLKKQLTHFNHEQDIKVQLLFSIVTTIFLPMTFIAGVFGMNFSEGGALVHVLERENGTNAFYFLCILSIVTVMVSMHSYGLLDMFVQRKWNRFIGTKDRLQRKTLGVVSYSSYSARDIVNRTSNHSTSSSYSEILRRSTSRSKSNNGRYR